MVALREAIELLAAGFDVAGGDALPVGADATWQRVANAEGSGSESQLAVLSTVPL